MSVVDDRGSSDSTAPMDRTAPSDATAPLPPAGGSGGETGARPGETRQMPPVEGEPARWSASASVPPRTAAPPPVYEAEPLYDEPARGERSWLMPVVVGSVALLLLAALATGLWLIFNAEDKAGPGPSASPTAEPAPITPAPVTSAARPTTAPPSTAPPTAAPPSAPPRGAVVPPVVGLPEAEARQRLADAGLRADVVRQQVPGATPGTVVSSQPGEGTQVEPNSVVRLVVAAAAPSPPRSSPAG